MSRRVCTSVFGACDSRQSGLLDALYQIPAILRIVTEGVIDGSATSEQQQSALKELQRVFVQRRDDHHEVIEVDVFWALLSAAQQIKGRAIPGCLASQFDGLMELLNDGFSSVRAQDCFLKAFDTTKTSNCNRDFAVIALETCDKPPPQEIKLRDAQGREMTFLLKSLCYNVAGRQNVARTVYRGESGKSFEGGFTPAMWYYHSTPQNPIFTGVTMEEAIGVAKIGTQILLYVVEGTEGDPSPGSLSLQPELPDDALFLKPISFYDQEEGPDSMQTDDNPSAAEEEADLSDTPDKLEKTGATVPSVGTRQGERCLFNAVRVWKYKWQDNDGSC